MKTLIKPVLVALTLSISTGIIAQVEEKEIKKEKKESDVIIRKKGDSKEKMTIVIDGDKITVNGKPVEDFKSDELDVIKEDTGFDFPMPPMAPIAPDGFNVMSDDFVREIRSNKAFLGVMSKKVTGGAEITEVTKESAAEKAGLKTGDIISKIDDTKIEDADDLYKTIGKYKPEDKVTVTYKRAGKESKAEIKLGENKQVRVYSWNNGDNDEVRNFNFDRFPKKDIEGRGNFDGNSFSFNWHNTPRLGVQVQETEDGKGVKVLDVDEDEAAGKAGIKEDDIITSINGKEVKSLQELKEVMRNAKDGDTVKLEILRDGKPQTLNVKFPKELQTTDL